MDRSAVVAFVASEVSRIAGFPAVVTGDTPFARLPLDSLDCIDLTVAVEDEFGVDISGYERILLDTVGDLADLVTGRASTPLLRAA